MNHNWINLQLQQQIICLKDWYSRVLWHWKSRPSCHVLSLIQHWWFKKYTNFMTWITSESDVRCPAVHRDNLVPLPYTAIALSVATFYCDDGYVAQSTNRTAFNATCTVYGYWSAISDCTGWQINILVKWRLITKYWIVISVSDTALNWWICVG